MRQVECVVDDSVWVCGVCGCVVVCSVWVCGCVECVGVWMCRVCGCGCVVVCVGVLGGVGCVYGRV